MSQAYKKCTGCGMAFPDDTLGELCSTCVAAEDAAREDTETDWLTDVDWLREALPQYHLIEEIGRGGMGRVLKARDTHLDRMVAIKVLTAHLEDQTEFVERFKREARAMARLVHPNIIQIYGYGEQDKACFIIMEFVEGVNLGQMIQAGSLTPEQALQFVPGICNALQYAHDQGVIHRDVKPGNVMVTRDGSIKVADFGLAKMVQDDSSSYGLTRSGIGMGTPGYMAPEQERDIRAVDHRADIYSLGALLYHMLTGKRPSIPFVKPSQRVQVDVRIDEVVLKAMDYNPEQRFQHISELKTEIETCTDTVSRPRPVRRKSPVAWIVLLVMILLGAVGWSLVEPIKAMLEAVKGGEDEGGAAVSVTFQEVVPRSVPDVGLKSPGPVAEAGDVKRVDLGGGVQLDLVFVPAGSFSRGSTNGEGDENPVKVVTLADGFWMGKTEVTNQQYRRFLADSGYDGSQECNSRHLILLNDKKRSSNTQPIVGVSWHNARAFCSWLSKKSGLTIRLPSEAAWEYACRAGTTEKYAGILAEMAWYRDNADAKAHVVASKNANAFGLYDMHGNVWEWCLGAYQDSYEGAPLDGGAVGDLSDWSSRRVFRGGCWFTPASFCRSANRVANSATFSNNGLGFRVLAP